MNIRSLPHIHGDNMSREEEVSLPILEQIFKEMFKNLEKEEAFDDESLEEIRNLANNNSLIKGNKFIKSSKRAGGFR